MSNEEATIAASLRCGFLRPRSEVIHVFTDGGRYTFSIVKAMGHPVEAAAEQVFVPKHSRLIGC